MLAIIPARGGSKGVPRKNIRQLANKPLIQWTIEAAMNASCIDRIILSTDDHEIADVCRTSGIEIPFMRPNELAKDGSLGIDCYIYTMERLISEFDYDEDEFVVLLPTAPFRNAADIDNAVEMFYSMDADSVISCAQLPHPLDWVCRIDGHGKLNRISGSFKMANRQEADILYVPNGGVSVFKYSILKKNYSFYTDNTHGYIMPPERSIDIDTEYDFSYAEYLMNRDFDNA
jgi:CMP-N,N'-diacetyllegionaminic acid synthase